METQTHAWTDTHIIIQVDIIMKTIVTSNICGVYTYQLQYYIALPKHGHSRFHSYSTHAHAIRAIIPGFILEKTSLRLQSEVKCILAIICNCVCVSVCVYVCICACVCMHLYFPPIPIAFMPVQFLMLL